MEQVGTVLTFLKAGLHSSIPDRRAPPSLTPKLQLHNSKQWHITVILINLGLVFDHHAATLLFLGGEQIWYYRQYSPETLPYKIWYYGNFGTNFASHQVTTETLICTHDKL